VYQRKVSVAVQENGFVSEPDVYYRIHRRQPVNDDDDDNNNNLGTLDIRFLVCCMQASHGERHSSVSGQSVMDKATLGWVLLAEKCSYPEEWSRSSTLSRTDTR
jgi:hypothetical protein